MIDTVKNIRPLPRMRTISEAIAEIREADPNTAERFQPKAREDEAAQRIRPIY